MSLRIFPFEKLPAILKMLQFTFRLLEFSSFFFAVIAGINYSLVIKNFRFRDVLVLGIISYLFIVPSFFKLNYEKQWTEEKLWPAVEVNENTGRVHAGCATFEYLPSKAFENLDYIKTRENRVYVLTEDGTYKLLEENSGITIENEEKNGTELSFSIRKIEDEETINLNELNILNNSSDLVETEEIANQDKKKELVGSDTQNGITLELPYIYYLGYAVEIETSGVIQKLETFETENGFVAISIPESFLSTDDEVTVYSRIYRNYFNENNVHYINFVSFGDRFICDILVRFRDRFKRDKVVIFGDRLKRKKYIVIYLYNKNHNNYQAKNNYPLTR